MFVDQSPEQADLFPVAATPPAEQQMNGESQPGKEADGAVQGVGLETAGLLASGHEGLEGLLDRSLQVS